MLLQLQLQLQFVRYHVPRSFLRDEGNTLVLFEEFGGDPSGVGVETVVTGQICANADEGTTLELSCQQERFVYGHVKYHSLGRVISDVKFASFGDPTGACGVFETPFKKGSCESPNTLSFIKQVKYTFLSFNFLKIPNYLNLVMHDFIADHYYHL